MRITNLEKGEDYNLKPDTQIQVERTNPFFNDFGEQTTPLELPASERNRRLLGFPDSFGRRVKMTAVDVAIQDGEYFAQCRQMVLSAQYKGSISTAFYINDGSFYSRIQKVKLKDIFKDEFIPGINTVEEGIEFCRSLRTNTNPHYAIFPALITDDSGLETGFNYKMLNAFGKEKALETKEVWMWKDNEYQLVNVTTLSAFNPDGKGGDCDFYNAVQRTEYVGEVPITLPPGYYMSPFIRANYLLKRIFAYFGYDLQENFFTQTEPFAKMVVMNNVMDVLVNGKIKVADLVPDTTCADFIAVFRKKFCCEFTSDEGSHTANIIFLRDALAAQPVEDLTNCVTQEPTIAYKAEKDYQRLTLASADKVDTDLSDSYEDIDDLAKANPGACFNPVDGAFYKQGWSGNYEVITKIGEASQDYNTGEDLEPKEIKIADIMPEFRTLVYKTKVDDNEVKYEMGKYLYIGAYISLNSKMVVAGEDKEEESESANKQKTILAFSYLSDARPEGTISAYDIHDSMQPRIFDYALYYNGPFGIFEKFYRDYDLLLRNSLHEMKVKLLLSQSQKQNLPSYAKVVIRGVAFFFNKLKFTLGGKNEPVESSLSTIALMQPVSGAPAIDQKLKAMDTNYKWVGHERQTEVSSSEYENAGLDKNRTFTTIYPPVPSAEYLGKPYGKQTSYSSKKTRHATFLRHSKWKYTRTEVWLECIPK
ncbi:MAG: hypothetical protein HXN55_03430 [Prevotella nigrescens]|uniref:Uncharacterized protein n=1 Tax=Prevotella nigrescens TaxID=28133 RepID=A0A9D5WUC7_9BACT|nr:hypothetical protein [Prevotella nigrescens]MBF1446428.1 hypothetical protein [Prevotella nigrescens]DAS13819.1 MAG TPA: hypothetical protein [Caudoviricetes sp.]